MGAKYCVAAEKRFGFHTRAAFVKRCPISGLAHVLHLQSNGQGAHRLAIPKFAEAAERREVSTNHQITFAAASAADRTVDGSTENHLHYA